MSLARLRLLPGDREVLHFPKGGDDDPVVGDLRLMISAEATFTSFRGGPFGLPECLASPELCLPGHTGPPLLTGTWVWQSPRWGCERTFHPGPPAAGASDDATQRLFRSYAFVAVPLAPGKTGSRGFCADSTGRICGMDDASAPPVRGGLCASPCTELE